MPIICQVVNGHYFSYKINGLLMPDFFLYSNGNLMPIDMLLIS